ncbi:uncharacterized protein SOCE26_106700 [Sorangium cellulosum]|uniref:Uncharacterized protein n=1 Tax=Sorangium cellulosum TaxID=56 RepID=A0A2L0FBZ4_SORCE|nr:uncharacterized protein SOCE26_106700 [Sorangium cellulosum]
MPLPEAPRVVHVRQAPVGEARSAVAHGDPMAMRVVVVGHDERRRWGGTYELGPPTNEGVSWGWSGEEITGEDGIAVETPRFRA